jgi:hypothetical protein
MNMASSDVATPQLPVTLPAALLAGLQQAVGANRVHLDTDTLKTWGKDWTKHFQPIQAKFKPSFNLPMNTVLRLRPVVVVQVYRRALLLPMAKSWSALIG